MAPSFTTDETRTAGLLFGEELALGLVEPAALHVPEVRRAVRGLLVPSGLARRFQRAQLRRGRLSWQEHVIAPYVAARRAVLGDAAEGRPKLVVRVDGFPHHEAYGAAPGRTTEDAAAVHAVLAGAGVPYLMSVLPRVPDRPLDRSADGWREHDPAERDLLAELRRDGVAFALQGLDHRTRSGKASSPSELSGLKRAELDERLDTAQEALRDAALHADVFVAPWDRFDASAWAALAARFDVVCGGAPTIETLGFHAGPSWRGDAVWLPSYPPLDGTAAELLPVVRELVANETALWIPLTLRWDRELAAGLDGLRALAELLAAEQVARSWDDLLLAIRASHAVGTLAA